MPRRRLPHLITRRWYRPSRRCARDAVIGLPMVRIRRVSKSPSIGQTWDALSLIGSDRNRAPTTPEGLTRPGRLPVTDDAMAEHLIRCQEHWNFTFLSVRSIEELASVIAHRRERV